MSSPACKISNWVDYGEYTYAIRYMLDRMRIYAEEQSDANSLLTIKEMAKTSEKLPEIVWEDEELL